MWKSGGEKGGVGGERGGEVETEGFRRCDRHRRWLQPVEVGGGRICQLSYRSRPPLKCQECLHGEKEEERETYLRCPCGYHYPPTCQCWDASIEDHQSPCAHRDGRNMISDRPRQRGLGLQVSLASREDQRAIHRSGQRWKPEDGREFEGESSRPSGWRDRGRRAGSLDHRAVLLSMMASQFFVISRRAWPKGKQNEELTTTVPLPHLPFQCPLM